MKLTDGTVPNGIELSTLRRTHAYITTNTPYVSEVSDFQMAVWTSSVAINLASFIQVDPSSTQV
jgi:hypothetical protein